MIETLTDAVRQRIRAALAADAAKQGAPAREKKLDPGVAPNGVEGNGAQEHEGQQTTPPPRSPIPTGDDSNV